MGYWVGSFTQSCSFYLSRGPLTPLRSLRLRGPLCPAPLPALHLSRRPLTPLRSLRLRGPLCPAPLRALYLARPMTASRTSFGVRAPRTADRSVRYARKRPATPAYGAREQ